MLNSTKRFALIACICFASTSSMSILADEAKSNADSVKIRVASYNVEFSRNATPEAIGEMLKPYKLDLIGFNEAPNGDWTDRIGKVLELKHTYVGKISSANHKDKYKSILSRTPFTETSEHPISAPLAWNPASMVRVVTLIDNTPVAFYSSHLCASGPDDGHVFQFIKTVLPNEKTKNIIVVGDFNDQLGSPAMNLFEKSGLRPTWKDLMIDVSKLYTWNAYDPNQNEGVIDHIFFTGSPAAKATQGAIIELEKPLSDHKPIWAEISFPVYK